MTFLPITSYDAVRPDPGAIVPFIGERAALLLAYSVSVGASSAVPSAFYRRILVDRGEDAENPQVTEAEQLLIDWAREVGRNPAAIDPELRSRIEGAFSVPLRSELLSFAAAVVASGVVASAAGLEP